MSSQKIEKKQRRNEKIKILKIAFLTEELNLTSKEAQEFWPIYNKYDKKLHLLERLEKYKLVSKIRKAGGVDSISEQEAKSIMLKIKKIDGEVYKTKLELDTKLTNILTYKKLLKFKTAEKKFVRNLMRKYKRKKGK
ncbi:MAG: sensor of ECF-type sigma factor [Polaribacter sp.]|uniref:sensor of ECF-type sigma factor n=1 Tax=Polaribacter sp. TaxID=1920175 RepID=UPI002F34F878